MPFKPVNPGVSFPELEKEILEFWEKEKIFKKSLEKEAPQGTYVFYEGPPTANGKPGLHHVLARAFKDVMPRYKTMCGYNVPRKAGWDTHGLPVEIEVEKRLGINGKQDIEKIKSTPEESIIEFNKLCRESVWQYKTEWETLTKRMGFWLDLENPYITYDNSYIESVWWVISQAFEKGLLYKGHKIVPYCPRCGTALSSHELAQGYKEVEEKSIYVKFKLKPDQKIGDWATDDNTYFLVWTTTPWTLPGNIALAVNKNIKYWIIDIDGKKLILSESRIAHVVLNEYKKVGEVEGLDLLDLEYIPLYDFIKPEKRAYFSVGADFVSDIDGTGIVHIAPAFGEDDYNVGKENDLPILMTLDKEGKMRPEIGKWAGQGAKESDSEIILDLEKKDLLFKTTMHKHDYPFCWRCDTALLYYAKDSWFIEMSKLKKELFENNKEIHWVPDNIKNGRFGEWLVNVKDWAISRDRYWGTPLPVWECAQCGKQKCVSSIEDLKKSNNFSNIYPKEESLDLHKPYIDQIKFDCECGGEMTRSLEVMDVWLDSGTMPFSQLHYPFENKELIDDKKFFPANYISEAVDQTRGWFYTLHAVSTILELGPCYKNVICLGHILDGKGKKMSKSKGNIIDPIEIADKHGFDAIRWFMYTNNQPGEPKLVSEESIKDQVRRFLLILWNTYSFFVTYANIKDLKPETSTLNTKNIFDRWLISQKNQTIKKVTESLSRYDIFTATRTIEDFVIELSTWYIRRNKKREDHEFMQILHNTLIDISKLLAPFTPFVSEEIYRNLTGKESVHLDSWPEFDEKLIDTALDHEMKLIRDIIEIGHSIRKEQKIKVRQPLSELRIINHELRMDLQSIISDELNVKSVNCEEVPSGGNWAVKEEGDLKIALNLEITSELKSEGNMREIVRLIQDARKEAKYAFTDRVSCYYQTNSENIKNVIGKYQEEISRQTILSSLSDGEIEYFDILKESEIDGDKIKVLLKK
uniref:Isoleucine--tRNA ligase n=1 Tax=candidate division CPR3 bacterium TaxID=2268181 RepID=A0A7C4M2J7_UNCC3